MECDIVIPIWNQLDFTKRCIESIQKKTRFAHRLILIDNNSEGETRNYLTELARLNGRIKLIRNEKNLGFVKAANQGLRASNAPYICLLNNDTIVTDGWLSRMMSLAESDSRIGLVNPKSESPGELSLEDYSKRLSKNKGQYVETNQCMGFCMLIKREVMDKIGYLDEIYGMGGFDDTDFSKRADILGYKCVCAKDAYVYHDWHASFRKAGNREKLVKKNEEIFFNKWGRYLRIGYPISCDKNEDFYTDINTSLGLAREWNWIHVWLSTNQSLKRELKSLSLPEHQNLRLFSMSGIKIIFYFEILFRLVERRFKGKKLFDAVLVSDKRLLRILSFFKDLFSVPVFYIERNDLGHGDNEKLWRERAKGIVELIRKEKTR